MFCTPKRQWVVKIQDSGPSGVQQMQEHSDCEFTCSHWGSIPYYFFFSQPFVNVLGMQVLASLLELDRPHQSLVPKPAAGGKPQPVILKLHPYQRTWLFTRHAREMTWPTMAIRFNSMRITVQWWWSSMQSSRAPHQNSYKCGFRLVLLYLAKLCITLLNREKSGCSLHQMLTSLSRIYVGTNNFSSQCPATRIVTVFVTCAVLLPTCGADWYETYYITSSTPSYNYYIFISYSFLQCFSCSLYWDIWEFEIRSSRCVEYAAVLFVWGSGLRWLGWGGLACIYFFFFSLSHFFLVYLFLFSVLHFVSHTRGS